MKTKTKLYIGALVLILAIGAVLVGTSGLYKGFLPGQIFPGSMLAKPDFGVDSYNLMSAIQGDTRTTYLRVKVKNQGLVAFTGQSRGRSVVLPVEVTTQGNRLIDHFSEVQYIDRLNAGETKQLLFIRVQKAAEKNSAYRYQIMIDPPNVISELNEENNYLETKTYPYIGVRDFRLIGDRTREQFTIKWTDREPNFRNPLAFEIVVYSNPIKGPNNTPFDLIVKNYDSIGSFSLYTRTILNTVMPYIPTDQIDVDLKDLNDLQKKALQKFLNPDPVSGQGTIVYRKDFEDPSGQEKIDGLIYGLENQALALISKDKLTGAKEISNVLFADLPSGAENYLMRGYMIFSFFGGVGNLSRIPAPPCGDWLFGSTDSNYIGYVLAKAYQKGYYTLVPSNNSCNFYRIVNRAEAAAFVWNTLGKPKPTSTTSVFTDVPRDSWFFNAVQALYEKGYLPAEAEPSNRFKPGDTALRNWYIDLIGRIPYLLRQL